MVLLCCSSQHTVLTYRKVMCLLLHLRATRTPQQVSQRDDTALMPSSEWRRLLSPAWAAPPPTCGLLGPGVCPLPLAMALLWLDLFLQTPAITEVVRGVQPQSYSWLSCLWPYRLFSLWFVLPGGQVLPRLLPK